MPDIPTADDAATAECLEYKYNSNFHKGCLGLLSWENRTNLVRSHCGLTDTALTSSSSTASAPVFPLSLPLFH